MNHSENTYSAKAQAFLKRALPALRWGTFAVLVFAVVLSSCGLRKSVEMSAGLEVSKPYQPSKTTVAQYSACPALEIITNAVEAPSVLKITPDNHSFGMLAAALTDWLHPATVQPVAFAERREFGPKVQRYILYKQLKRAL